MRTNIDTSESHTPERETFIPKTDEENRSKGDRWQLGARVPKAEIAYFSQMIIVYVIITTPIINLSLQNGLTELWISLLSSSKGYALSMGHQRQREIIKDKERFIYVLLKTVPPYLEFILK